MLHITPGSAEMFSCWHCSRSTRLSPRACFAWALAVLSLWAVSCGQGRAVGRHSPVWRRAAGERSAPERARRSTQRNVQLRAVAWQVQTNVLLAHHSPGPARPCPGVRSIKCTSHRQITVARRRKSRARSQRDLATLKSLRVLAADSLTVGNYGITVPSSSQAASCHRVQAPHHTKPMLRDRKPQQEEGINCTRQQTRCPSVSLGSDSCQLRAGHNRTRHMLPSQQRPARLCKPCREPSRVPFKFQCFSLSYPQTLLLLQVQIIASHCCCASVEL
jgi:hypothetical protein